MKPETEKRLRDARRFALELQDFIEGQTDQDFHKDRGLQLIVHKLLEIVGEALNGARKGEPEIAAQVEDLHRYIALRHQITHGYDTVDYNILWNVAQREIPALIASLDKLLGDASPPVPGDSPNP
jgi:uncharacterized protein with HEPN domain